jgi:CheY-like chemotaxis protein
MNLQLITSGFLKINLRNFFCFSECDLKFHGHVFFLLRVFKFFPNKFCLNVQHIQYQGMTTSDTLPLRILLVDDDKDDCDLFKDALQETGLHATVNIEHEGVKIMHLFNTRAEDLPHLIFLDLNMPKVSGTECLREIRRASYMNGIPVIIFSTSCTDIDVEETFAGGANLYIQKPSVYQELVQTLKKVLVLDWRKYISDRQRSNYVIAQRNVA